MPRLVIANINYLLYKTEKATGLKQAVLKVNNNLTKEDIMRKVLFFTTLFAFLLTSSLWAADISGTWTVTMKSPQGSDESFNLAIKASGDNLAVTCIDHPVLKTLEGTGTLKGDAIKMSLKSTGQTMAGVGINFTGTVTGNKMAGTREIDTSGMSAGGGGGQGGAGGGAPGGGQAAGGQGAQGRQGGAPAGGGQAPAGGQAAAGGAPGGAGSGAPGGGAGGGAPGGGGQGGGQAQVSNAWTAVKK